MNKQGYSNINKIERLRQYVLRLQSNENGKLLYEEYKPDILSVKPEEVFELFTALKEDFNEIEILEFVDKLINVFYTPLTERKSVSQQNALTERLIAENRELSKRFAVIREIMKQPPQDSKFKELKFHLEPLSGFYSHYQLKENVIFPVLEQADARYDGLTIMWALHKQIELDLKQCLSDLSQDSVDIDQFNRNIASLFFDMLGMVQKEELILIPEALRIITDDQWTMLIKQSKEYPPVFSNQDISTEVEEEPLFYDEGYFKTPTGSLTFEQIAMVFNGLPVDMTYVDENDKVVYFTRPKDRIFPRSAAVIGRHVNNCHPPQSVHVVQDIVKAFKDGSRDIASFWIDFKGRKILIQYFAMRNADNVYKGVLEVSQDITEIQKLEGQRRLLQWE